VAKRKVITSFKDKETPRYTAAFSSDGKILATLVRGEEIRFFDIDNPLVESSVYRWTEGKLSSMTFSPDGKWIAFADRNLGKICILDLKTKKLHMELPFVPKCAPLAFSPDGKWLAAANDRGAFAMWNTKEFSCVMNWPAKKYFSLCECLAFSPDSKQIAVGAGPVRFIDRETGKITMWLSPRHRGMTEGVAFSPDGKTLASSGWESVRAWDFTNLKFVVPGPDHGVVPRPKGLPWRFEPSNKK
jgi:WD40 repeat protein